VRPGRRRSQHARCKNDGSAMALEASFVKKIA